MIIKFWGARGSIPTPDPECMRYGGDTTCVEIRTANGKTLILDAGTGIRRLGQELMKQQRGTFSADLFFSHGHWDHIQGFPFFAPAYVPGNRLTCYGLFKADGRVEESIRGMMGQLYFPVDVDHLASELKFHDILEGARDMEGIVISTCAVNHPQGAVAYRIDCDGASVVFCPDTEHTDGQIQAKLVELCAEADYLIHDSHYAPDEYASHRGWGHSTYEHAIEVTKLAKVQNLVLFHHAPEHNDEFMDHLVERARQKWPHVIPATRDLVLSVQRFSGIQKEATRIRQTTFASKEDWPTYEIRKEQGVLHVSCPASRQILSSKTFQNDIVRQADASVSRIVLDLVLVDRVNSTCLGTFGKILNLCQQRTIGLEFINVQPTVMDILRVTRFTEVVKVQPAEPVKSS